MAELVLGPILRHVDEDSATIWFETDGPAELEVLGCRRSTFEVAGHHYALLHVQDIEGDTPYDVKLDGRRVWPCLEGWPESLVRPVRTGERHKLMFGSCRVGYPHTEPYTKRKDDHEEGREYDALLVLAQRMRDEKDPSEWPDLMLFLGDQVYADEVSPGVREFIESRRDLAVPPGEQVADFEEYTRLYHESWGQEHMRWLMSVVPSAMIFDDHDVHDDWNTSQSWVRDIRSNGWWDKRIVGGFASYFLYQHLGNLAPRELEELELFCALRDHEGDAVEHLFEFAWWADREVQGTRWSFARDIGRTRLVMIDSRAGRVLDPDRRSMVDDGEWDWIDEHVTGDVDHLVIGSSLPLFLLPALHWGESWDEAIAEGAWGHGFWARAGEWLRRTLDLEHWAAFRASFERMCELLRDVSTGRRGEAPASVVVLSGDVHHAYLAEVGFPKGTGARSPVWQAVCSPFRNPLDRREQKFVLAANSNTFARVMRALARSAGVEAEPVAWRLAHEDPWFDNQIGTLSIDGRTARLTLEKVDPDERKLREVFSRDLA